MSAACQHIVGTIATKPYTAPAWNAAIRAFARVVHDFNVRGQREEIPHPGFDVMARYCTQCGAPIDADGLLSFAEAYSELDPLPSGAAR